MDFSGQRVTMNGRSVIVPRGFRFRPDDEVLVFDYLTRKALNRPMEFNIPELRSCTIDPWDLLGENNKEVYYFVKKEELERSRRETLSGYWEESEEEKVIVASDHHRREYNFLQGRRKSFTFYIGRKPRGDITPWFMHEFRLMSSRPVRSPLPPSEFGQWRVLKIGIKEYEDMTDEDEEEEEEDEEEEEEQESSDPSDGEVVIN